ncbi:hypothetical protein THAOC_24476 [Thalassiosira oceanica]|uniref:Uncharacterized protein n=1 Tax=Thalassiosira oceanica TaxID=159749 RepID=K0RPR8_THAOC|nr:hypothetical protein THAOC_24476 [Thalassiosira oceanica]|eukprot:EJK55753.1 hypothetical protein THAOC_24476 [Thalassiosira oceanica]
MKLRWSTSTLPWSIPGQDIAGDPSLDPSRSSGDTGSVWTGSTVEEQGPPAPRLASAPRAERPSPHHTIRLLPAADRSDSVQGIHPRTTDGRSAPLVRPGSAHRARLRSDAAP